MRIFFGKYNGSIVLKCYQKQTVTNLIFFFCFELSVKTVYKIPLFNIYHFIQNVKNRIKDEFWYGIYTYLFLKVNLDHTYLYLACTGIKKKHIHDIK